MLPRSDWLRRHTINPHLYYTENANTNEDILLCDVKASINQALIVSGIIVVAALESLRK